DRPQCQPVRERWGWPRVVRDDRLRSVWPARPAAVHSRAGYAPVLARCGVVVAHSCGVPSNPGSRRLDGPVDRCRVTVVEPAVEPGAENIGIGGLVQRVDLAGEIVERGTVVELAF